MIENSEEDISDHAVRHIVQELFEIESMVSKPHEAFEEELEALIMQPYEDDEDK